MNEQKIYWIMFMVYLTVYINDTTIYIGKSKNVKKRYIEHKQDVLMTNII